MGQIRWNIVVSTETDQPVRVFLASQCEGPARELSRFIEAAVRAHILELAAAQAKAANADVGEDAFEAMVEEAVQWASDN